MKKSTIAIAFTTLLSSFLSAEPSAFGAGDLDSPAPYGLTSNEKVILETKKKLHTVVVKSNNQANEVESLRERIDGLQSIVESLSRKSHKNKLELKKLREENLHKSQNSDEYEKRLSEVVEHNALSIEETKKLLEDMNLLVLAIQKDYVTKAEFQALIKDVNKFKELMAKELKASAPSKKSKKSSALLYKEAKEYFNKKYYTKAIENYETLIKRNYKPAYSHYMIGEMNYRRKNYANALSYFKKSTALYSKGSYMPNLMLHSAIAMQETGDKKHANAFFKAIIKKYPDSKEAREAKKYL